MACKYEEENSRNKQLISLKLCTVQGSMKKSLIPSQRFVMPPPGSHRGYDQLYSNNNPSKEVSFSLKPWEWFLTQALSSLVSSHEEGWVQHNKTFWAITRWHTPLSGEKLLHLPYFTIGFCCQLSLHVIHQLNFIISQYTEKSMEDVAFGTSHHFRQPPGIMESMSRRCERTVI